MMFYKYKKACLPYPENQTRMKDEGMNNNVADKAVIATEIRVG